MDIKNCYKFMLENIPQFQEFKKQIENQTTEELLQYILENKEQD